MITVAALIFGAAPLPYATMLFSHTMVVGLLCLAVWLIAQVTGDTGGRTHSPKAEVPAPVPGHDKTFPPPAAWLAPLAGFSVGLALASEYTAGLVVVGLTVLLALGRRSALLPFCLGAAPPLLLIPAYSYACFGDPFILPYSLQACFPAMREGLYAIKWPDAETAFNLLFSPTRGLFFWTPFLLMAGFGYGELARRSPRWFWLTYVIPLLQIVIISGRVWDWQAGPTLGPRYLAPILPLLALPCALGVQRWPKLGLVLAAYSVAITTLATLTDACPPGHVYNPLIEIHIPAFLKAEFSPNLGMLLGLPPYASVAVFYAVLVGGLGWLWRQLPAEARGAKI